ncbi:rod shape-determining protein MreD [Altererythrobacter aurantiacus]|uniref:Rod shape-determining protein MreD n=1 Tax=Parapontixanthobacter aurantiacus TaxID=1463599 RepID=A0A844ZDA5_9SPHN|nr:rod shape-determining protein MreD [Parapontixanthobacter aurantiacus]MXO85252.1 rod shape-determining protein MreD [Parapontixanthobacter aurantiacus]
MERYNPRARADQYGSRLHREHSTIVANIVPWASIMLGSILPLFVITAAIPWMPPLGYLTMIAWRIVRPGLLPMWAGFPLGLFDDLFSGQPLGSGILLFSLTLIAFEVIEARFPWRSFAQDWFTTGLCIIVYILFAMIVSGAKITGTLLFVMVPQIVLAILLFPLLARFISHLDRFRLVRWRSVR